MTVELLTEPHLRFLSLKGGCKGSSESTLVEMPHYWKSRVTAQLLSIIAPEQQNRRNLHEKQESVISVKLSFYFLLKMPKVLFLRSKYPNI